MRQRKWRHLERHGLRHSLPQDAQLLWLGAEKLEDSRVRHWVSPQGDVQEVHLEGVATPIFQLSGHEWILLPPWLRAKISSTLVVWDLGNPESGVAVQTCWKASVRAGRWVKLERELGRVSAFPPRTPRASAAVPTGEGTPGPEPQRVSLPLVTVGSWFLKSLA